MKFFFNNFKIFVFSFFFLIFPFLVLAADLGDAFRVDTHDVYSNNDRLDAAAYNAGYNISGDYTGEEATPEKIVNTVITTILSIIGVIFVVLIIYGGILWMIAQGNEQKVEKAKNIITESLIGLAIVMGAYAISYFVLSSLMNNDGQLGANISPVN